ncbi:MAG: hypothetical protein ABI601_13720 [bacterium]
MGAVKVFRAFTINGNPMPRPAIAVALALACCVVSPARAQVSMHPDEIQPGARVRITAPGVVAGRYVGTVLTRSGDTLTVGSPNGLAGIGALIGCEHWEGVDFRQHAALGIGPSGASLTLRYEF